MKFVHFGCWNQGKCNMKEPIGMGEQSITMKLLNDTISKSDDSFDFISVAGDNYYATVKSIAQPSNPDKLDVYKYYNENKLISGFNCLPKNVMKYVIFGNNEMDGKYNSIKDNSKIDNCVSINKMLDTFKMMCSEFTFFDDIMYVANLEDDIKQLVIFIDTTIYELKDDMLLSETCYKYLFTELQKKNKDLRIKDLIFYQNNMIKSLIEYFHTSVDNVIIIGHHPIISIKEINHKPTSTASLLLMKMFEELTPLLKATNVYYLCADLHAYQTGIITLNTGLKINQYIVGSGGTKLDKLVMPLESGKKVQITSNDLQKNKDNKAPIVNICIYEIIEQSEAFGFIVVENFNRKIKVKFIDATEYKNDIISSNKNPPILNEDNMYKKYMKYKIKFLALRENLIR
jgi:hypothetical protein